MVQAQGPGFSGSGSRFQVFRVQVQVTKVAVPTKRFYLYLKEQNEINEKSFLVTTHTRCKSYFLEKLCGVIQKQPSTYHPIKQLLFIF